MLKKYNMRIYMKTGHYFELFLPAVLEDGRLDTLLKIFYLMKTSSQTAKKIRLNWSKVNQISPAGLAILACLFDSAVEHKCRVECVFVKKVLKNYPVVENFVNISTFKILPKPTLHDFSNEFFILSGCESSLNILFMEKVRLHCGCDLSEDLDYSCQLIVNELMQNSVDHSTSERYYLYAGKWGHEFHVGILDMGITIPAKLEQKYSCASDVDYLTLSLKEGISTRRQWAGGLGLSHTFALLKEYQGRLTIISRNAQIRRYFRNKKIQKGALKHVLNGTWCFARFPYEEKYEKNYHKK